MSRKRILVALLLAGTFGFLGLHRLYVGKYITGLLQMGLFVAGAVMMWPDLVRIYYALPSLHTLDDMIEFSADYPMHPLPVFMLAVPVLWALLDCALLAANKFKDGAGNPIKHWV